MLKITESISIPLTEFEFTYVRASGPGGQNVNKVSSKAVLRWSVALSPSLPEGARLRFLEKYGKRLTVQGEIILSSQKHRDQKSNVQDCLEKLADMIRSVANRPTTRRATKPTLASKRLRVETKREKSQKKESRRSPELDD
jgi:ribosome-associated protein